MDVWSVADQNTIMQHTTVCETHVYSSSFSDALPKLIPAGTPQPLVTTNPPEDRGNEAELWGTHTGASGSWGYSGKQLLTKSLLSWLLHVVVETTSKQTNRYIRR